MRPPRVTLEERAEEERWSRDWVLLLALTPALPSVERVEATPLEEPLERVVLLDRAWLLAPLERTDELLPDELLLEREVELLPEERELLLCWVELPPLERRVWAHISGAVSMAKASIREAAIVINLLIALKFLS